MSDLLYSEPVKDISLPYFYLLIFLKTPGFLFKIPESFWLTTGCFSSYTFGLTPG